MTKVVPRKVLGELQGRRNTGVQGHVPPHYFEQLVAVPLQYFQQILEQTVWVPPQYLTPSDVPAVF